MQYHEIPGEFLNKRRFFAPACMKHPRRGRIINRLSHSDDYNPFHVLLHN